MNPLLLYQKNNPKVSYAEMARRTGISRWTLYRLMRRQPHELLDVSIGTLVALHTYLGVDLITYVSKYETNSHTRSDK